MEYTDGNNIGENAENQVVRTIKKLNPYL